MVALVSPGSGAVSNFGMRSPGASASSHSTARAVNQAANRQGERAHPGADRDAAAAQAGDDVEDGDQDGDEQHRQRDLGEPAAQHLPREEEPGSPPVSIVAAGVELETMFATVVPTRPSCAASRPRSGTASPAFPAVSVIAGMSREISGPCSWGATGWHDPESWS